MEAVSSPRSAEPCAAPALELRQFALRLDSAAVEDRVFIAKTIDDEILAHRVRGIERDDYRPIERQRLQRIDVVAHADRPRFRATVSGDVIPCGPGLPVPGQKRRVGM